MDWSAWTEAVGMFSGYALCVALAVTVFAASISGERRKAMGGQQQGQQQEAKPSGVPFDFNNNGVPDFQEGWFWLGILNGAKALALAFAKPHTVAYRAAQAVDGLQQAARDAQGVK